MNDDQDWDIDQYKTDYECEDHWKLRRRFMVHHKENYSEDELVCLAQVFINIEMMGCRYPAETMQQVSEMSKEVAREYRNERTGRLKRTFVKASDAAEEKAKRRSTLQLDQPSLLQAQSQDPVKYKPIHFRSAGEPLKKHVFRPQQTGLNFSSRWGDLVVFNNSESCESILRIAAERAKVPLVIRYEETDSCHTCKIYINEIFLAKGEGPKTAQLSEAKKDAKRNACEKGVNRLKRHCYTVVVKQKIFARGTEKKPARNKAADVGGTQPLDTDNKGFRMMKILGWTGGGLGANSDGISQPIGCQYKVDRQGLGGNTIGSIDEAHFNSMLQEYCESIQMCDLVFSNEFTKEERAHLHKLARKLNLKSKSFGKDEDRILVISRKYNVYDIVRRVLLDRNVDLVEKYEVIEPQKGADNDPDSE